MRLINSDSQVVDAKVIARKRSSASSSSSRIDLGGVALVCALGLMLVAVGFSVYALVDARATRDLLDVRDQAWRIAYDRISEQQHNTDTSAKLLERRYMDMTAYAELNGWKINGDGSFGPTGNLKRMTGEKHGR